MLTEEAALRNVEAVHDSNRAEALRLLYRRYNPPTQRTRPASSKNNEIVIQVDYCFMKTRPQDDLITTLIGVDDSFGRRVAILRRTQRCKRRARSEGTGCVCAITGSATHTERR